jgi:hypothetical protein
LHATRRLHAQLLTVRLPVDIVFYYAAPNVAAGGRPLIISQRDVAITDVGQVRAADKALL